MKAAHLTEFIGDQIQDRIRIADLLIAFRGANLMKTFEDLGMEDVRRVAAFILFAGGYRTREHQGKAFQEMVQGGISVPMNDQGESCFDYMVQALTFPDFISSVTFSNWEQYKSITFERPDGSVMVFKSGPSLMRSSQTWRKIDIGSIATELKSVGPKSSVATNDVKSVPDLGLVQISDK